MAQVQTFRIIKIAWPKNKKKTKHLALPLSGPAANLFHILYDISYDIFILRRLPNQRNAVQAAHMKAPLRKLSSTLFLISLAPEATRMGWNCAPVYRSVQDDLTRCPICLVILSSALKLD